MGYQRIARHWIETARAQAKDDWIPAIGWLAHIYRTGEGVRRNQPLALRLSRKAAALGDAESMFCAGNMYEYGEGTPRNYRLARAYYANAVQCGHPTAACNLGVLFWYGHGGKRDSRAALALYRRAAKGGDEHAYYNLGLCYRDGTHVRRSRARAIEHLWLAAMFGHPTAGLKAIALEGNAVRREVV